MPKSQLKRLCLFRVPKMGYLIAMAVLPLTTAITLSTRIGLPSAITRAALHDYLATPAHWPKIVLSSVAVRGEAVDAPLGVGGSVDEIFGLPPVLPLEVRWTCTASDRDRGLLIFESRSGLSGIAENCKMDFRINTSQDSTDLELKMSFDPGNGTFRTHAPSRRLRIALHGDQFSLRVSPFQSRPSRCSQPLC